MKKIIIISLAIVFVMTSITFAGNNKTETGSGINPAGQSNNPGFDNGHAWWKNNSTCSDAVLSLDAENLALIAKIGELESQLKSESVEPTEVDTMQVRLQETDETHPNSPNVGVFYYIAHTSDPDIKEQILALPPYGTYTVEVKIISPEGDEINIFSTFDAIEEIVKYRNYSIKNVK